MEPYEPSAYWQSLLERSPNLQGVSWPELSLAFNRWQYRARRSAVRRLIDTVRGRHVLDVGAGTGYWVELWLALGAAEVCGVDLVSGNVDRLRSRFPSGHFSQADISEPLPFDGPFELISAIDVLLHITDEHRYGLALANLRRVAAPGSRLLLLEPVTFGAPQPFVAGTSSRVRSLAQVRRVLAAAGWTIEAVQPVTWLYSNPVEMHPAGLRRVLDKYWFELKPLVRGERAGALVGATLYPLDRLLCHLPWGPSSKALLAVAR